MMEFTDDAKALLKRLEGCRLTAYRDQAGVWTIGYGHTGKDVTEGLVWTQAEADAALDHDLARFVAGVDHFTSPARDPLSDEQFSALVIFAFNVGLLAFAGSTALRDVLAGRLSYVPAELARWDKIKDASGVHVVNAGLVHRRAAEINLWNTPAVVA